MLARHRYTFRQDVDVFFVFFDNTTTLQSDSYQTLTFSATYWQPFIDEQFDTGAGTTVLAGPFLDFLLEFARKYQIM